MFRSLWQWLFGRRVKWVITCIDEDGREAVVRIWLRDPTPESIRNVEENSIEPLVEMGWQVICRPRRPV